MNGKISAKRFVTLLSICITLILAPLIAYSEDQLLTPTSVIENSTASDWRTPEQENLLYMRLETGQVVFELAADFAPNHIENLKKLLSDKYFDGLAVIRSHDNYVVQWGDQYSETDDARPLGTAAIKLKSEFTRPLANLQLDPIESRDPYAEQVGFSNGFAVAAEQQEAWLIHCYGALGVGRGMQADSGNTASLYMVSGHAPRHLDRNITLLGRAIKGMELLSSLPRGTGVLGFYETAQETTAIESIRLGTELAAEQRLNVEIMRTDTATFESYVQSRTVRKNDWFVEEVAKIGICNVGVPIRTINTDN